MQSYEVSADARLLDLNAIHAFLTQSYWSPGIPIATVERAVLNSVCVGAYLGNQQVGFARMVTDQATFAYLADVYVLGDHRGKGLSKLMVEKITQLPQLQGLRRVMLVTRDAHGLYERFGFAPVAVPSRIMERLNPNAYAAPPASAT